MAGRPAAGSSATVPAPARVIATSAAASLPACRQPEGELVEAERAEAAPHDEHRHAVFGEAVGSPGLRAESVAIHVRQRGAERHPDRAGRTTEAPRSLVERQ